MFLDLKPQEEQYVAAKVEECGGAELVQGNDAILRELLEYENNVESARVKTLVRMNSNLSTWRNFPGTEPLSKLRPDISERTTQQSAAFLKDIKNDLREDWRTAVDKNMTVFERKFEVHQRQLQDDLASMIHEHNSRIIRKLSAGPHDRIRDQVSSHFSPSKTCLTCW